MGSYIHNQCSVFSLLLIAAHTYSNENPNMGYLLSDRNGNIIFEQNINHRFVPAPIRKILTDLAVLQTFGADFRFKTGFKVEPQTNALYLKGYGVPVFISETIALFCRHLAKISRKINHIFIDQSYFNHPVSIPGKNFSLNFYNAIIGTLSANFNTVNFKWEPDSLLVTFLFQYKRRHYGCVWIQNFPH